ncbi:MAG: caspase family protein [Pseudomonadota bacterium]|nr:caspase family protein [Pseudomonadota bacterium]
MNIDPKKTFAIVIGVEKYGAGQDWNLSGPAHDACQFATWLCQRQVPLENIRLFVSPLAEKTRELALPNGLSSQAATEQNIRDCIENELTKKHYLDLLYFYWGGHGVMNTDGERRLFYADATFENKKNLDLNKLLNFLRTDYFQTLFQQIVIVDTCANYLENMNLAKKLPSYDFPQGGPLENREQYVLMAAKPGEFAKNLDAKKTGLFTKELMSQLASQPDNEWPPNMDAVRMRLTQHFTALREAGKAEQTPTYSYYRNWHFNEGTLVDTNNKPQARAFSTKKLSIEQKMQIVDALLECPHMQTLNQRQVILRELPHHIFNAIPERDDNRSHVFSIVDTCLNFRSGIMELVRLLRTFDTNTEAVNNLDTVLNSFHDFII